MMSLNARLTLLFLIGDRREKNISNLGATHYYHELFWKHGSRSSQR